MAKSYKKQPTTTETCAYHGCTKKVTRTKSEVSKETHRFCSAAHGLGNRAGDQKYTREQILWVADQSTRTTRDEIAATFNLSGEGLKSAISRWRRLTWFIEEGLEIGAYRAPVGSKPVAAKAPGRKVLETPAIEKPRGRVSNSPTRDQDKPAISAGNVVLNGTDKVYKTRKIVKGPIDIMFKDKNHTKFNAKDATHFEKIIDNFGERFGAFNVTGLPEDYKPTKDKYLVASTVNSDLA